MRPEWRNLWERCPAATPFQSPEWLLPWWHHLFRGGELWTLSLRREGRLAGLAPLFIWGGGCVSFLGSGITDYLDVLMEPGLEREGTEAMLNRLAAHAGRWQVCDLQELREDSPLLASAIPPGLEAAVEPCSVCPVVELPARVRPSLRSTHRRLRQAGEVRRERAGAETLSEYLEALFRLHGARWEERHQSGMLSGGRLRDFHCEVARGFLERGLLRFHGLRFDGILRAVLYGFLSRGRFYAYLSGFDPEFAPFSPGNLLLEFAMEEAERENAREFDFLRKPEAFKHRWGGKDRRNRRLLLRH